MSTNRVVVTGYGVTSPIGNTPEEFWTVFMTVNWYQANY